jgi:general L-amino acid transport system permease protein
MITSTETILPPPTERYSILGWARKNLFYNLFSSLVTLIFAVVVFLVIRAVLLWAFTQARWGVIWANLRVFMVGPYPIDQMWRIWLCMLGVGLLVGLSWGIWVRSRLSNNLIMFGFPFALALLPLSLNTRFWWVGVGLVALAGLLVGRRFRKKLVRAVIAGWLLIYPLAFITIRGVEPEGSPFGQIPTSLWGGLMLTFLITWFGVMVSFPIGVFLAIGRQSRYPIIRSFCVLYIELVRAVPLITVLFMAQVLLPLFLPAGFSIDRLTRALLGIAIFNAAYIAEIVRGGLQGIVKGQFEAASALGMNGSQTMLLVVLPQAMRAVIVVIVDQTIGLFRDTTLVLIVGLIDLLGISRSVLAQPQFQGTYIEVYCFIAMIYWVFSYLLSVFGQRLEVITGAHRNR